MITRRNLLSGMAAAGLMRGLPYAGPSAVAKAQDDWARLFKDALADNPLLLGWQGVGGAPLESGALDITGAWPKDLSGRFFRNGPAIHERFGQRSRHWFDADGMIQEFHIANGQVRHRGRVIDTPKRRQETAAGKKLFSGFGTHVSGGPAVRGPDALNTANISTLHHGDELMALWEAGSPTLIDADTLAAKGFKQLLPDLKGAPFTAHPKTDPDGTLWAFGYSALPRPILLLYHIGPRGEVKSVAAAKVDYTGLPHDFVVTAKHVVIILPPLVLDRDALQEPGATFLDAHRWQPELGTRVLIADKNDLSKQRWAQLPPGFFFHHGNAWEEADGTIRLDLCWSKGPDLLFGALRNVMRGDITPAGNGAPHYASVMVPPGRDGVIEMSSDVMEFTKVAPNVVGQRHDHVYGLSAAAADTFPFNRLVKRNLASGATDIYGFGDHIIAEEHVFVPRPDQKAEDDGWLIGTHLDTQKAATNLAVFDAKAISDGPIATAALPYPLPLGFHGIFVADD